jgi:hypothetical protein
MLASIYNHTCRFSPRSLSASALIQEVDLRPTEKQQTCPHPPSEIVFLPDNITLCHHCYGFLDENLRLQVEGRLPADIVAA